MEGWIGRVVACTLALMTASCALGHEMVLVTPEPTPGVRWLGAAEARDQTLNTDWRGTVGDPVIGREPARPFSTGVLDGLRVVGWNVNVGGGDVIEFVSSELGLDCTGAAPRELDHFSHFVLALQETHRRSAGLPDIRSGPLLPVVVKPDPRPGADLDVTDLARICGLALVYVPSARNGPTVDGTVPEDKGNAVLSTLPLSDFIAIELPFEAGRKVAVAAAVRVPTTGGEFINAASDADLLVVSVHLDVASTFVRTLGSGNTTRLRQARGLTEALDPYGAGPLSVPGLDNMSVLVAGDMNTWSRRNATLEFLNTAFPDSPRWDGLTTRGEFTLDHVFFRRGTGVAPEIVDGTYGRIDEPYFSDHQARTVRVLGAVRSPN